MLVAHQQGVGARRSQPRWRPAHAAVALALAMLPALAHAELRVQSEPHAPAPIYGGERVAACGWPTTVYVADCTGTLVHPEVVIYASHCGTAVSEVFLGDAVGEPGISIATSHCEAHAETTGTDWAFCTLAQPVLDIAITPPLMGCETELLQPQAPVWIVGFGDRESGEYGEKFQAQTKLFQIEDGEAFIGGDGADTCYGDSGGPAYLQLDDGSWRAFGITSYAEQEACGMGTWFSMMHTGMPWFETSSGIDITPCHDADGSWNPGPDCGGFPISPMAGEGSWSEGCAPGPLSGPSSSCGPAFGADDDDTAPSVAIVSPADGAAFELGDDGQAAVHVSLEADDGTGSGVAQVQLLLDGVPLGDADVEPPWDYELVVDPGGHTLTATALDVEGNLGDAPPIDIVVGDAAGDDDSSGDDAGTSGAAPDIGEDNPDAGCGCRQRSGADPVPWLLALISITRRRRSRHA
jgi:Trypsin/Penicillin-Binding Protein C-terminus Family